MARRNSSAALLDTLIGMSRQEPPVIVAIDGRCAAGKTTLAAQLETRFGWCAIHMDDFFLRPEQRTPERYAEPGGNIDYERFVDEVLLPLRSGTLTRYRPFDCRRFQLAEPIEYTPAPLTLVEGSYSCHPNLWPYYDLRVFLDIDPVEQRRRIAVRNGSERAQAFFDRWIPLEELYFSSFPLESRCDYHIWSYDFIEKALSQSS